MQGTAVIVSYTETNRTTFIGKEKDNESDLGDFGVRKYDDDIGRFTSIDPLWENYYAVTPYHYSANNPVSFLDPSGLTKRERAKAIRKALEYEASDSRFKLGAKGVPGKPVDCSGMVSRCIYAAGRNFLNEPVSRTNATDLSRNYQEVSFNDVEPGNIVVKLNYKNEGAHAAIVVGIAYDKDGNRIGVYVIESSVPENKEDKGRSGPMISLWKNKEAYHYYKWDKPENENVQNKDYDNALQEVEKRKSNYKNLLKK